MVNEKAPENLKIYRKKGLTAVGGILCLLIAAALIALVVVAYFKTDGQTLNEVKTSVIISFVGIGIFSALFILNAVLCFLNLRYPCILATDEKGLYDYSGFLHCGFIAWEDIQTIHGGKKLEAFLDILSDNTPTAVKIDLKNDKLTFANKSRLWKIAFSVSSFGCVRIRTLCSTLSKKNTYALLTERYNYYTANTD